MYKLSLDLSCYPMYMMQNSSTNQHSQINNEEFWLAQNLNLRRQIIIKQCSAWLTIALLKIVKLHKLHFPAVVLKIALQKNSFWISII